MTINEHLSGDTVNFLERTTCHGVGRFVAAKSNFKQIVWLIILLGLAVYLGVSLYNILENFFLFQLRTSVHTTPVKTMELPDITICNQNFFSASALTSIDETLIQKALYSFPKDVHPSGNMSHWRRYFDESLKNETSFLQQYYAGSFQTIEFIKRVGWRSKFNRLFNDTVPTVWFSRVGVEEQSTNITMMTDLGLCYRISSNQIDLIQRTYGNEAGIQLMMDIQQDEYTTYTMSGSLKFEAGVRIILSTRSQNMATRASTINIPPGFTADIAVKAVRRETINKWPWYQCISTTGYSQRNCIEACQTLKVVEECQCVPYWYQFELDEDTRVCSLLETSQCVFYVFGIIGYSPDSVENCTSKCLTSCNTTVYTASYSLSGLAASNARITASFAKLYNITPHYVKRNFVGARIFFSELAIEVYSSSEAMSANTLTADLGGQLGLVAGISILTLVELMEFIMDKVAKCCCCGSRKVKIQPERENSNGNKNSETSLEVKSSAPVS